MEERVSEAGLNITKPQISFVVPLNNFPMGPWKAMMTSKAHSTVPLEERLSINKEYNDYSLQCASLFIISASG